MNEEEFKEDLDELLKNIYTYCNKKRIMGSFNNPYGEFLLSFEIKEIGGMK